MGREHESAARTVLIADDDPDLCDSITDILARPRRRIVTVSNGHALVSFVAETLLHPTRHPPVALIFVDVHMPGISGLDAIARLRRCGVDVPVVVITGDRTVRIDHICASVGAVAVLDKPFRAAELRRWASKFAA